MNFENGKLYVVHDQIPDDKIGWNLYIPELFYFWNGKKHKIVNKSPSWTEGIIKRKPIGIYKIDNKVPSSISSQILPIIQKQENRTMTSRQIKLVENYIRKIVKKTLNEEASSNPPGESRLKRLCQKYGVSCKKVGAKLGRGQTRNWSADYDLSYNDSKSIRFSPSYQSEITLMKYFKEMGVPNVPE